MAQSENPMRTYIVMILVMAAMAWLATARAFGGEYMAFPEDDVDDVMSADDHFLQERMQRKLVGKRPVYRKEKASRPHDSVTIIVNESTSANANSKVDLKRNSSNDTLLSNWLTLGRGDGGGVGTTQRGALADPPGSTPRFNYNAQRAHKSDSKIDRGQSFKSTLTGEVIEVLPNGYLVVEARKRLTVSGEAQTLVVTGVVNPDHMNSNSEVKAEYVMDMAVKFEGKGPMSRMDKRGWGAKFFDFVTPF